MSDLKLAVYVIAHTLKNANDEKINKLKEKFKELKISKVYLENYRDGLFLSSDLMLKFKEIFEKDFEVAGGMAIGTWGIGWGEKESFGFNVACIADEKNRELVKTVVEEQAKVFDEIIIDDFWANWCHSEKDIQLFNSMYGLNFTRDTLVKMLNDPVISRLWCEYSSSLVYDTSKEYVVKPAKMINNKVKITLKVAEWRENFYHRGLKLERLAEIFDNIYVGTEAREFNARYGSLYIVDFVRSLVGDKLKGVWFDTFIGGEGGDYGSVKTYLQQFLLSAFGLTEEITLFHAGDMLDFERAPLFDSVKMNREKVGNWRNIVNKKYRTIGLKRIPIQHFSPQNSDKYIEDHLGIIGIPLEVSKEIKKGDLVLITESDLYHIDIVDLLNNKEVDLLFTASAVKKAIQVLGSLALEIFGISDVIYDSINVIAMTKDGKSFYGSHYKRQAIFPVGPIFNLTSATPILYAYDGTQYYPIVFKNTYNNKATVYVSSLTTYMPYLLSEFYPEISRQVLRDIIGDHVGVRVKPESSLLLNVSLIVKEGLITLVNLNDFPIRLRLAIDNNKFRISSNEPLTNDMKVLEVTENEIKIRLKENSFDGLRLDRISNT
ncbi:hypothetical protein V6M85_08800 [Sulfolobus tengchongensis]|uniref:Permease n=1 Tax=Sulfolobus tengchongensis TaxID=207809 RepID=A0AAX4KXJ6_9CREN